MANEKISHSRYRKYGEVQPCWKVGVFKIRLPFVHYAWSVPDMLQALFMCATCLGAIPVLTEVLGVEYGVALSMVIINGFFYNMHVLLGDPVVPGWITPAIPIVTAFLTDGYAIGPDRTHALIALQMEVGIIFLVFGITGIGSKVIDIVPNSVKAGVLMGGGLASVIGEFKEGGRFHIYPVAVIIGLLVAYFCLFSPQFAYFRKKNKVVNLLGKFGMLPAIIIAVIVGPIAGEIAIPTVEWWPLFKIPEFSNIFQQLTPFGIGFPSAATFIAAIPTAIVVYIIAFGDFVTSEALLHHADVARPDEAWSSTPTAPTSSAASVTWPCPCAAPTPRCAAPCGRLSPPLWLSGTRKAPRPWNLSIPAPAPSVGPPLWPCPSCPSPPCSSPCCPSPCL